MAVPKTMQGVQLTGHGGPEKLIWNDAKAPASTSGRARTRLEAHLALQDRSAITVALRVLSAVEALLGDNPI